MMWWNEKLTHIRLKNWGTSLLLLQSIEALRRRWADSDRLCTSTSHWNLRWAGRCRWSDYGWRIRCAELRSHNLIADNCDTFNNFIHALFSKISYSTFADSCESSFFDFWTLFLLLSLASFFSSHIIHIVELLCVSYFFSTEFFSLFLGGSELRELWTRAGAMWR